MSRIGFVDGTIRLFLTLPALICPRVDAFPSTAFPQTLSTRVPVYVSKILGFCRQFDSYRRRVYNPRSLFYPNTPISNSLTGSPPAFALALRMLLRH
jgi:hypothetical protein